MHLAEFRFGKSDSCGSHLVARGVMVGVSNCLGLFRILRHRGIVCECAQHAGRMMV